MDDAEFLYEQVFKAFIQARPGERGTAEHGEAGASINFEPANLQRVVGSAPLECHSIGRDRYGREVAFCSAKGRDLSCAQVEAGFAVQRYGALTCDLSRHRMR